MNFYAKHYSQALLRKVPATFAAPRQVTSSSTSTPRTAVARRQVLLRTLNISHLHSEP